MTRLTLPGLVATMGLASLLGSPSKAYAGEKHIYMLPSREKAELAPKAFSAPLLKDYMSRPESDQLSRILSRYGNNVNLRSLTDGSLENFELTEFGWRDNREDGKFNYVLSVTDKPRDSEVVDARLKTTPVKLLIFRDIGLEDHLKIQGILDRTIEKAREDGAYPALKEEPSAVEEKPRDLEGLYGKIKTLEEQGERQAEIIKQLREQRAMPEAKPGRRYERKERYPERGYAPGPFLVRRNGYYDPEVLLERDRERYRYLRERDKELSSRLMIDWLGRIFLYREYNRHWRFPRYRR